MRCQIKKSFEAVESRLESAEGVETSIDPERLLEGRNESRNQNMSSISRRRYTAAVIAAGSSVLSACADWGAEDQTVNGGSKSTPSPSKSATASATPTDSRTRTDSATDSVTPSSTETPQDTEEPTETPQDTEEPTETPQDTEEPTPEQTQTPTPDYPGMSDAGQRMYETIQYHAMIRDLNDVQTDFEMYDWVNQRKATPDDLNETFEENYWASEHGIFDWNEAESEIFSISQGHIVNLKDSADTDEIYDKLKHEGLEESGQEVEGTKILEGKDIYTGEKDAAVAVDKENNAVLYLGGFRNSTLERDEMVRRLKKGLEAYYEEKSLVDTQKEEGEVSRGEFNQIVEEEEAGKNSPFYIEGVIDAIVGQEYNFLNGYRQVPHVPGLSSGEDNWVIGSVLKDKKPKDTVDMYRAKFSADDGIEKSSFFGEYTTKMWNYPGTPFGRDDKPSWEKDNPDHA